MDWDNQQICHWLTAMGLGEYVEVFRGMFVKLGIRWKESSAFGSFAFPFGKGKRGGVPNCSKRRLRTVYFYFLGGGHFKYLYLCGGTPKIIKILVVVTQIIDGVLTPQVFFPGKALSGEAPHTTFINNIILNRLVMKDVNSFLLLLASLISLVTFS